MPGEFVIVDSHNPRRTVSVEEYKKLLEYAGPDFRDVLVCAYESAMRSSEIANLTAGQVHLNEREISGIVSIDTLDYIDLGIFDTKTGARRTVPVSAELKEVLKRRLEELEPEDYVFSNKRGKHTTTKISLCLMRLCKKAKILYGDKLLNEKGERVGIVFHCFRHTRTTRWVEKGFSDEIVRRATGHKSLEAYRRYVNITDPRLLCGSLPSPKNPQLRTCLKPNGIKTV